MMNTSSLNTDATHHVRDRQLIRSRSTNSLARYFRLFQPRAASVPDRVIRARADFASSRRGGWLAKLRAISELPGERIAHCVPGQEGDRNGQTAGPDGRSMRRLHDPLIYPLTTARPISQDAQRKPWIRCLRVTTAVSLSAPQPIKIANSPIVTGLAGLGKGDSAPPSRTASHGRDPDSPLSRRTTDGISGDSQLR
jgi:hypothetical protein